jgi:uncharacterized protein YbjT (DUF2867 family)
VRDRAKAKRFENIPTVEIVKGDMSSRGSLTQALNCVDRALMISTSTMDMVETQRTFIDASKAAGVRHVIKFSGLDARPDTTFPFGLMHKEIEEYLRKSRNTLRHPASLGLICAQLALCRNICARRRVSSMTMLSISLSAR